MRCSQNCAVMRARVFGRGRPGALMRLRPVISTEGRCGLWVPAWPSAEASARGVAWGGRGGGNPRMWPLASWLLAPPHHLRQRQLHHPSAILGRQSGHDRVRLRPALLLDEAQQVLLVHRGRKVDVSVHLKRKARRTGFGALWYGGRRRSWFIAAASACGVGVRAACADGGEELSPRRNPSLSLTVRAPPIRPAPRAPTGPPPAAAPFGYYKSLGAAPCAAQSSRPARVPSPVGGRPRDSGVSSRSMQNWLAPRWRRQGHPGPMATPTQGERGCALACRRNGDWLSP
eukprot:scaffold7821_cov99-Isochrysis_galbana.AAC.2